MADPRIQIIIEALNKTQAELTEAKQQIDAIKQSANSAKPSTEGLGSSIGKMAASFGLANVGVMAAQKALHLFTGTIKEAFNAVEDYKLSVSSLAALMTTFAKDTPGKTLTETYKQAYEYSEALVEKMEEWDAKTIATGKDLTAIAETLTSAGVQIDINSKRTEEGFVALANAIKLVTAGQNQDVQLRQEIRALVDGDVKAQARIATIIGAQVGDLKAAVEQWKKQNDFIGSAGEMLKGFVIGAANLSMTWTAVKSTTETIATKVMREVMKPTYQDIIKMTFDFNENVYKGNKGLEDLVSTLRDGVLGTWLTIKNIIETINNLIRPMNEDLAEGGGIIATSAKGWGYIAAVLPVIADRTGNFLKSLWESLKVLNGITDVLAGLAKGVATGDFSDAKKAWNETKAAFDESGKAFKKAFSVGGTVFDKPALKGAVEAFPEYLEGPMEEMDRRVGEFQKKFLDLGLVQPRVKPPKAPELKEPPESEEAKKKREAAAEKARKHQQQVFQSQISDLTKFNSLTQAEMESANKKELQLLEERKAFGEIGEAEYWDERNRISEQGITDQITVLDEYARSLKIQLQKMVESKKYTNEEQLLLEEKFKEQLGGVYTEITKKQDELAVSQSQNRIREKEGIQKITEIRLREADESEKATNRQIAAINALKVKRGEMLPGDAMVSEFENEYNAITNSINRLEAALASLGVISGPTYEKLSSDLKQLKEAQAFLDVKRPDVYDEGWRVSAETIGRAKVAVLQYGMQLDQLTGKMDAYTKKTVEAQIAELQLAKTRATGDEITAIQQLIDYYMQLLGIFNEYGPAVAGISEGIKDLKKAGSDTFGEMRKLITGFGDAFAGTLTKMFTDWAQFDGNFMKDLDALKGYWKDFWGQMVNIFAEYFMNKMKTLVGSFLDDLFDGLMGKGKGGSGGGGLWDIVKGIGGWLLGGGEEEEGLSWEDILGEGGEGEGWDDILGLAEEYKSSGKGKGSSGSSGTGTISGILGTGISAYNAYKKIQSLATLPEKIASMPEKVSSAWEKVTSLYNEYISGGGTATEAGTTGTMDYEALSNLFAEGSWTGEGIGVGTTGMGAASGAMYSQDLATILAMSEQELAAMGYTGATGTMATEAGMAATTTGSTTTGGALAAAAPWAMLAAPLLMTYMAYTAGSGRNEPMEKKAQSDIYTKMIAQAIKDKKSYYDVDKYGTAGLPYNWNPTDLTSEEDQLGFTDKWKDPSYWNIKKMWGWNVDTAMKGEGVYKTKEELLRNLEEMGVTEEELKEALGTEDIWNWAFDVEGIEEITPMLKGKLDEIKGVVQDGQIMLTEDTQGKFFALQEAMKEWPEATKEVLATSEEYGDIMRALGYQADDLSDSIDETTERVISQEQSFIGAAVGFGAYTSAVGSATGVLGDMIGVTDAATNAFYFLNEARALMAGGLEGDEPARYAGLLSILRDMIAQSGQEFLNNIPNIEGFINILRDLGITLEELPNEKTISVNLNMPEGEEGEEGTPPPSTEYPSYQHGGFVMGYNAFGGRRMIMAHPKEYVLSQEDVEFVEKVKGVSQVINLPPVLPRVNVNVNNQSSAEVAGAGAIRVGEGEYIIDVILKDLHKNGRLRKALSFV